GTLRRAWTRGARRVSRTSTTSAAAGGRRWTQRSAWPWAARAEASAGKEGSDGVQRSRAAPLRPPRQAGLLAGGRAYDHRVLARSRADAGRAPRGADVGACLEDPADRAPVSVRSQRVGQA